ncbi:50S ribosomal protein L13 [Candidatus Pacearchaeota archaeon]|nr:50S ribosomal protein L13 [Candidatus Pacearchaeota archaeon]MBI2057201.1 50S ribosomal protein L13 [Candidatus Pacearchaeota archaeon]
MKIIDGSGMVLGRLASYAAKESLKGEEIAIVNCSDILITGNRKRIEKEFLEKRSRFGSSQKGPKHPRKTEKIVKRTIRGMLPNYREGRGREAWKRIRCYDKIPKEFEEKKLILLKKENKIKTNKIKEFIK